MFITYSLKYIFFSLFRLGDLFSNKEVENLVDKKDRIQSKLFCKLIASMYTSGSDPSRGHYGSMASVYKCSICNKLVTKEQGTNMACKPQNMMVNRRGNVCSVHVRYVDNRLV